ncbi:MAG: hypothetical protein LUE27_11175, partial [Clostridia bacterium]|nr:hypothetical protein [Clostridia bacterium]
MLGASSADEELAFSMEDPIRLFDHVLTIREYLQNTFLFIHEYWEDKDMEIGYILRALFAYWGIRSICKLYAEDYKAELDQQNIQNLNGIFSKDAMEVCEYLDKTMYGKALELNR